MLIHWSLAQFIVQSKNKIAESLNNIKKSISNNVADPNPLGREQNSSELQVSTIFNQI